MPEWRRIYLRLFGCQPLWTSNCTRFGANASCREPAQSQEQVEATGQLPMLTFRLNLVAYEPPEYPETNSASAGAERTRIFSRSDALR
jgi:hypothetical protein